MKPSHEDYLKLTLRSKKLELENIKMRHMIAIAEHDVKKEMITAQIDSIEKQLEN